MPTRPPIFSRALPGSICAALLAMSLAVAGCDSKGRGPERTASTADADAAAGSVGSGGPATESADAPATARKPPAARDLERYLEDLRGEGPLVAVLHTSSGDIACELHAEQAPMTVANFVGLARGMKAWIDPETDAPVVGKPFYDGVIFHRVVPGFMVQAGDRTGTGQGGPGYTFPDEFVRELRHDAPGVLSMANTGPDTNGSQFFILEAPAPHLDFRHTVFGQCDDLEVVREIARVPTGPQDRPEAPPVLESVEIRRGTP